MFLYSFQMKKITLLCLVLSLVVSIRINSSKHTQQPVGPIVGAYSTQDVNNLADDFKEIDTFLRGKFPQLQSYNLTKAETQVV